MNINTKITDESGYVDKLSDISQTTDVTNFDLLDKSDKQQMDQAEAAVHNFLLENQNVFDLEETKRDELYNQAIDLWNELKGHIKNARCTFDSNGLEMNTISDKLHKNVDYTAETIFYGLHLKKHVLDKFPKVKNGFNVVPFEITFSNAVALYHILTSITVKGLDKQNYAFANILLNLTEVSKVYTHYDNASGRASKAIHDWIHGLSPKDAITFNNLVVSSLAEEANKEAEEKEAKVIKKAKAKLEKSK